MTHVHPGLGGCQHIPTASLRTLGLGAHGRKGMGGSEGNPGASRVASARPYPPWALVSPVSNGEIASSNRLPGGARRPLEQEGGTPAEDPWGL